MLERIICTSPSRRQTNNNTYASYWSSRNLRAEAAALDGRTKPGDEDNGPAVIPAFRACNLQKQLRLRCRQWISTEGNVNVVMAQ